MEKGKGWRSERLEKVEGWKRERVGEGKGLERGKVGKGRGLEKGMSLTGSRKMVCLITGKGSLHNKSRTEQ